MSTKKQRQTKSETGKSGPITFKAEEVRKRLLNPHPRAEIARIGNTLLPGHLRKKPVTIESLFYVFTIAKVANKLEKSTSN